MQTVQYAAYIASYKKARAMIVSALGDKPLRAIQFCRMRSEMWDKLHERYSGNTIKKQISVLTSPITMKLTKGKDMGDHVADMRATLTDSQE